MTALNLRNVEKTYKTRKREIKAVCDLSFDVQNGEIFGLLGMNGAGKTTTIKMCTGLIDPDCGNIEVFGYDIVRERERAKSLLNVSPQETAVAPSLSVAENLRFIARVYGASKADADCAVEEILQKLKLIDRKNDRAGKLSGGLMRRLSVGMALITRPKLVFLDEPTLGLDILTRRELWQYIIALKTETAVVLTTHYLEEAEKLCDRVAVMSRGRLAAIGTAEELRSQTGESSFENAFLKLAGAGDDYER